jgi:CheY-like chemotaxis protein
MSKNAEMTPLSDVGLLGRRVLVADDVAHTRWSYVGLLRDAGARVTEARDGLEALDLARADRPDLILADMAMPRLDGLGLCAALREEAALGGVPVVLLSDGAPPQAVWGTDVASRSLVDAVMAALATRGVERRDARPEPFSARANEPANVPEPELADVQVERENVRAQSTVAMHREPANHLSRRADAVWRLRSSAAPESDGSASGFGAELSVMSRIFGLGFIALLGATIALITWRTLMAPDIEPAEAVPVEVAGTVSPEAVARELPSQEEAAHTVRRGVGAFSGELRVGVDPSMGALAGQGVLELGGADDASVSVSVDGEAMGRVPLALALDEGVHRVRYQFEDAVADRFYYVKSGTTRSLVVITRPGGFVDAR